MITVAIVLSLREKHSWLWNSLPQYLSWYQFFGKMKLGIMFIEWIEWVMNLNKLQNGLMGFIFCFEWVFCLIIFYLLLFDLILFLFSLFLLSFGLILFGTLFVLFKCLRIMFGGPRLFLLNPNFLKFLSLDI